MRIALRLLSLAMLALLAWTCDVSGPKESDTLTLTLGDSLKTSAGNYDSLQIELREIVGNDTVFRKTLFHGAYENASALKGLDLGHPGGNFVIVLHGYKGGEKTLVLSLSFENGQAGQPRLVYLAPDSNQAPKWQVQSLNLQGKEGLPMTRDLSAYFLGDADGDSLTFTASFGVLDSALKWSWSPGFRDSGQKECAITATDNGVPPLSATLILHLTIADSVSALTVIISSPTDGFVTQDSTVPVQWTVGGVNQTTQTSQTLAEGSNKIKRIFRDSLGNIGGDSITVIRDNTPPGKPTVAGPGLTNAPRPRWTWKPGSGGNGQYRVKLDNGNLATGTTSVSDTSFTPGADLAHGRHVLHVQERDVAGNWSPADSFSVQVDLVKPDVRITFPADGHVCNLSSVQVQWTVDGATRPAKTVNLIEGANTITLDSTDPAGNKGSAAVKVTRRSHVIFVNNALVATGDGNSWVTAFKNLQAALGSSKGTEIWVAKGSYRPDQGVGKDSNFVLRTNVGLYGGFLGSEDSLGKRDWKINETILTGEKGDSTISDNMGPVVIGANQAIIDGFTVERGYSFSRCGGMYNFNVTPQILNCTFKENESNPDYGGGAMYINTGTPRIQNCFFLKNKAMDGGAIVVEAASPTILECIFQDNQADNGGAIVNTSNSSPAITSCLFINNKSSNGGAIWDRFGSSTYTNNFFIGNTSLQGGAISATTTDVRLLNCVFAQNNGNKGGGLNIYNSSATLMNCTFSGNVATDSGGAIFFWLLNGQAKKATLKNLILWGNTAYSAGPQIGTSSAGSAILTFDILHSDILGGQSNISKLGSASINLDVGNIDINPMFKNTADPDGPDGKFFTSDDGLNLGGGPCLNAGSPNDVYTTDILGAPRIQNGQVDMGAYEN